MIVEKDKIMYIEIWCIFEVELIDFLVIIKEIVKKSFVYIYDIIMFKVKYF